MPWKPIDPEQFHAIKPETMVLRSADGHGTVSLPSNPDDELSYRQVYQSWEEHCALSSGGTPLPYVLATLTATTYWVWEAPAPPTPVEIRTKLSGSFEGILEDCVEMWVEHGDPARLRAEIDAEITSVLFMEQEAINNRG